MHQLIFQHTLIYTYSFILLIAMNIATLNAQEGCNTAIWDTGFGHQFPTDNWSLGDLGAGTYGLINVVEGNTYQFSTCADNSPVSNTNFDTQLSLTRDSDNSEVAFNDDAPCSNIRASMIEWTATFSGDVRLALFEYDNGNCGSTGNGQGIAWRISAFGGGSQSDYMIESLNANNPINPGVPFFLSSLVVNIGGDANQSSTLRYYFSYDPYLDELDNEIGSEETPPLASEAAHNGGTTLTLSAELDPGTYYIIGVADADWNIDESDEGNNVSLWEAQVEIAGKPDYALQNANLSTTTVSPGQTITASISVKNIGSMAGSGTVLLYYHYSDNNSWDGNATDPQIGDEDIYPLAVNASANRTEQIAIPSNAQAGTHYILFRLDATTGEINLSNNLISMAITVSSPPDYTALTIGKIGSTLKPGVPYRYATLNKNLGGTASKNVKGRIYISSDANLDTNVDIAVGEETITPIASGQEKGGNIDIVIPSSAVPSTPGKYHYNFIYKVDADQELTESNENNNVYPNDRNTVYVLGNQTTEYIVEDNWLQIKDHAFTPSQITVGHNFMVDMDVFNIGQKPNKNTSGKMYLSADPSWDANDYYIGEHTITPIDHFTNKSFNGSFSTPNALSTLSVGTHTWYLIYRVNENNADWTEQNTSDNEAVRPITIQVNERTFSDFRPGEFYIDPQYLPLGYWRGYVVIENISTISTISTIGNCYYSEDAQLSGDDVFLTEMPIESIAENEEVSLDFEIIMPHELTDREGYLIFKVDPNNDVEELDEENNTVHAPIPSQNGPNWQVPHTGQTHTIILTNTIAVQIDHTHLTVGDYIGAFYTDGNEMRCAGKTLWTGENTAIAVFGDEARTDEKDGFGEGEIFQWKVWQAATQTEHIVYATYESIGGPITHTDTYGDDGLSQLTSLSNVEIESQSISLQAGWNMISSYIYSTNPDMSQIFTDIKGAVNIVKDNAGDVYYPEVDINNIGDWDVRQGYRVFMTTATELKIQGQKVDPSTPIGLKQGWNILAYLNGQPQAAENAFANIAGDIEIVKDNDGNIYLPEFNINSIGDLQPGQGYQVMMKNDAILNYTARLISPKAAIRPSMSPQHYIHNIHSGYNASFIIQANDLLEIGDEVGVFNSAGKLCGFCYIRRSRISICDLGDDPQTLELEGLTEGEEFEVRIWKKTQPKK